MKIRETACEKDARTMRECIRQWMRRESPHMTIDTLLTWPDRASEMAMFVCKIMQMPINPDNVHAVCLAALNGRKRGDLK